MEPSMGEIILCENSIRTFEHRPFWGHIIFNIAINRNKERKEGGKNKSYKIFQLQIYQGIP